MKLALARAMVLDAGLLLLDEPTNHMCAPVNIGPCYTHLPRGLRLADCGIVNSDELTVSKPRRRHASPDS